MKNFLSYLIFVLISVSTLFAQDDNINEEQIEVFLIDSYVTPKMPHRFIVSFFTSDSCTSKILLDEKYNLDISEILTDHHVAEFNMDQFSFDTSIVAFEVITNSREGNEVRSELFELILPDEFELKVERDVSLFTVCCFGGIVFLAPSPTYVSYQNESYFGLSKEIPIVSFFSRGYNYPVGYFGIEYAHIFKSPVQNFMRVGYKQIIQIPWIEYVSPGVNLFTDFKGYNGISPEVTLGLVKVYNVFTLYGKYRFNFQPGKTNSEMHEISIGLYSNFFSLNL